jgi:type IV pilus assembly protein PilC
MPVFHYSAINERGQDIKGHLEASDERSAVGLLRRQALFVLSIHPQDFSLSGGVSWIFPPEGWWSFVKKYLPVTAEERIFFFQQLSLMIRAGLTLLHALDICGRQAAKIALSHGVMRMKQAIEEGSSFSLAIKREDKLFEPIVVQLVYSAEISGQMGKILERIAKYLSEKEEHKQRLFTSLTYPMIVVLVTIGVSWFMLATVVPKFVHFLSRRALVLPWSTQMLVNISHFMTSYGLAILVFVFGLVVVVCWIYQTSKGRLMMDHVILKIPVVGELLTLGAMAQMTQTMAVLLQSGINLLEVIRTTQRVISNHVIQRCLRQAAEQIVIGKDLAGSLTHPVIPSLIPQVICVGEKSGTLVRVLEEISVFYDHQLQAKTRQLVTWLEPILILVIGGMVGFVYFSFFQAVFQMVGR